MNETPRRYSPEEVPNKFNTSNNLYQLKEFGSLKLKQNDVISNSYCNGEEIHFMGLYHHYHSSTNGHVWFEQLSDGNDGSEKDRYENEITDNVTPDDGTTENCTTDNVTPVNDTPDNDASENGTTENITHDNVTPDNDTEFGLITNVASCREKNIYVCVGTFNCRTKALTHIEHDHNIEPNDTQNRTNDKVDEYVYTLHAFSDNGYTWIPAESYDCNYIHKMNVHENSHIIPMNVVYGNNVFVSNVMIRVCNDDGSEERHSCLFYSHDGKNWKYAVYLKHAFNRLIYGNEKFVMVSQDGYSAWSLDGINWNVKPFVNSVNGNEKVDCNITAMYCIGDKYTGIGYLYDDNERYKFNISHKTFMDQLMNKMDNNDLNNSDIVYNFIINCMRTRVFYSDDGETWYVTDKYVMKKEMYDEYEKYLLRLPKSILKFMIYHISVLSEHVNTITEKDGKFITSVAPYNVVLYSDDGKEWHVKQTLSEYMTIEKHESFGYETYVGFALDGDIYCSIDCENWYHSKVYSTKREGKEHL